MVFARIVRATRFIYYGPSSHPPTPPEDNIYVRARVYATVVVVFVVSVGNRDRSSIRGTYSCTIHTRARPYYYNNLTGIRRDRLDRRGQYIYIVVVVVIIIIVVNYRD